MFTITRRGRAIALASLAAGSILATAGITAAAADQAPTGSVVAERGDRGDRGDKERGGGNGHGNGNGNGPGNGHGNGHGHDDETTPVEPTEYYQTGDGAATIPIYPGWSWEDQSHLEGTSSGGTAWMNRIGLIDPDGEAAIELWQEGLDIIGSPTYSDWTIVDQVEVAPGIAAVAWYGTTDQGIVPRIELAHVGGDHPTAPVYLENWRTTAYSVNLEAIEGCDITFSDMGSTVPSAAAAEACLTSDEARAAFAIIAGTTFNDVPAPSPVTDFTTQNGTASFALGEGWTLEDRSVLASDAGGERWQNDVWLRHNPTMGGIVYMDGMVWGDGGPGGGATVLDRVELANGYDIIDTVVVDEWGAYPMVSVVERGATQHDWDVPSGVDGRDFAAFLDFGATTGCSGLTTMAEAEACLANPELDPLRDALATIVLHDVPVDARP